MNAAVLDKNAISGGPLGHRVFAVAGGDQIIAGTTFNTDQHNVCAPRNKRRYTLRLTGFEVQRLLTYHRYPDAERR